MTDSSAIKEISDMERQAVDGACDLLCKYTRGVRMCLAEIVASLCDVDVEEMLCDTKHTSTIQARRLYWYAYQQMTHETCEAISRRSCEHKKFTTSCVVTSIQKMSMLILSGTIWTKRWSILKRIITAANEVKQQEMFAPNVTVRVTQPQGVNIEIKKE